MFVLQVTSTSLMEVAKCLVVTDSNVVILVTDHAMPLTWIIKTVDVPRCASRRAQTNTNVNTSVIIPENVLRAISWC